MRLLLLTNMAAYQQIELAQAFAEVLGANNVKLGVQRELSEGRRTMGWQELHDASLMLRLNAEPAEKATLLRWIEDADVVIHGRFPIQYVRKRISAGKLTYAYQERVFKKGRTAWRIASRVPFLIKHYYSVNRSNYHLLAAGRYAAPDLVPLGLFRHRAWQFGYFIESRPMPEKPAMSPLLVVWCGRLMLLKRPERALDFTKALMDSGIAVHTHIIGDGELRGALEQRVQDNALSESVSFHGWQSVDAVNALMQDAHIALMSSDHREGWGVVINEAINNGCFPIVCDEVGSARWLIEHESTGLVYDNPRFDIMCAQFVRLFKRDPTLISQMSQRGHARFTSTWSAKAAAERLTTHANALLAHQSGHDLYESGPCSPA